jgi:lipopolysaccharide/colanic/teichoic acid biosynthesis glycosyltransferase
VARGQKGLYPRLFKPISDTLIASVGIVVCGPVFAVVGAAILMTMGRPILFVQKRAGRDGQPFDLYKFRTMSEATGGGGAVLSDRERLTPLGSLLRKTSLDELPQLINILKGDMSVVGPRPLYLKYLEYYTDRERMRHRVRPGITGLAQVGGRNKLLWDDRLELDAQYVERIGPCLDLKILMKTVWKILARQDVIVIPGEDQKPLWYYRGPRGTSNLRSTDRRP